MGAEDEAASEQDAVRPPTPRPRRFPLLILAAGGLLVAYLASRGPREQHVRFVLGDAAPSVVALEIAYLGDDAEVAREARLGFAPGRAPRVVSHEPQLADGAYRLRIDVDTRDGRRSVERQVTLSGGTTQVDLSNALLRTP